ncbi:MAG: DDE-type integrase/transposase/recombinase [Bacteriovoracaceae bacterium]|nr:DDE-type integrase/transposase/recombinase [Bacteriovoracaceae bacterium]
MSDQIRAMEIATFRFGIISEFVTGVVLSYGERERLLLEKSSRTYSIPNSRRTTISRSTIISWIREYGKSGKQIDGLLPKNRKDKGVSKSLSPTLRIAIKEMKKDHPSYTVPVIIRKLKQLKLIESDEDINKRTIYTFLKNEKLTSLNTGAEDRRKFEASAPNEIWQGDVMHGPRAWIKGVNRKTYLNALIDDHSRLIVHAEFYTEETLDTLKDCLYQAISKRGLPQKLYVDNGSCYKALNLQQITACLGIALKHARPYTPQGKGKVERWFRNVRDNFLPFYTSVKTLEMLNEQLMEWVDEYNKTIHSSTKITPYDRFKKNLECIRKAPQNLSDYFRIIDFRKVKMDRTIRLNSVWYEAPSELINKKVEVRYHEKEDTKVEVFFNNKSFGLIEQVDQHVNAKVGRNWRSLKKEEKEANDVKESESVSTGELFSGGKCE